MNSMSNLEDYNAIYFMEIKQFEEISDVLKIVRQMPGIHIEVSDVKNKKQIIFSFSAKEYKKIMSKGAGRKIRRKSKKYQLFLELYNADKPKEQIIRELNISERTYYRYKKELRLLAVYRKNEN